MRNNFSKRTLRHRRVRAKVLGTKERPRLSVYRSNKHVFLQLINDEAGKTILGLSDIVIKRKKGLKKSDYAFEAGKALAEQAKVKKITKVVFDRGGYQYRGRVKKSADGAREGGLKF